MQPRHFQSTSTRLGQDLQSNPSARRMINYTHDALIISSFRFSSWAPSRRLYSVQILPRSQTSNDRLARLYNRRPTQQHPPPPLRLTAIKHHQSTTTNGRRDDVHEAVRGRPGLADAARRNAALLRAVRGHRGGRGHRRQAHRPLQGLRICKLQTPQIVSSNYHVSR